METTEFTKMKKCPYCGEEILATAKKCKHCGEWLTGSSCVQPQNILRTEAVEVNQLETPFSVKKITWIFALAVIGQIILLFHLDWLEIGTHDVESTVSSVLRVLQCIPEFIGVALMAVGELYLLWGIRKGLENSVQPVSKPLALLLICNAMVYGAVWTDTFFEYGDGVNYLGQSEAFAIVILLLMIVSLILYIISGIKIRKSYKGKLNFIGTLFIIIAITDLIDCIIQIASIDSIGLSSVWDCIYVIIYCYFYCKLGEIMGLSLRSQKVALEIIGILVPILIIYGLYIADAYGNSVQTAEQTSEYIESESVDEDVENTDSESDNSSAVLSHITLSGYMGGVNVIIAMELDKKEDGTFEGSYYLLKEGVEKKLVGIIDGGLLSLAEYDSEGNEVCTFTGMLKEDNYNGFYRTADGEEGEFSLDIEH